MISSNQIDFWQVLDSQLSQRDCMLLKEKLCYMFDKKHYRQRSNNCNEDPLKQFLVTQAIKETKQINTKRLVTFSQSQKKGLLNRQISPITQNQSYVLQSVDKSHCEFSVPAKNNKINQNKRRDNLTSKNKLDKRLIMQREKFSKIIKNDTNFTEISSQTILNFKPMHAEKNLATTERKNSSFNLPLLDYSQVLEQQNQFIIKTPLFLEFSSGSSKMGAYRSVEKKPIQKHKFIEFSKMLDQELIKLPNIKLKGNNLPKLT